VRDGCIHYAGHNLLPRGAHELVKRGIAHSPEDRRILTRQTVLDNLKLGAYCRSDRLGIKSDLEQQFLIFPRLAERRQQLAGTLSGGEQQKLAIALQPWVGGSPAITATEGLHYIHVPSPH
jgi:branched-chain amino acid transport system ATP-binding protein